MQENKPILIVGLGNPGENYKITRHNIGFITVDFFAGENANWKNEKDALTTRCEIDGHKVIFVKPQTFMNDSGRAVGALMNFYKLPLENLIVVHDDMDLDIGKIKSKIGGSSAGHNGIKSIDNAVGADYKRIRIGIGHPRNLGLNINPADWVLGKFTDEQLQIILQQIKSLKLF